MDFDFDYGPDYGSGPQFEFDAGSLPTPAGSRLPNDPYANLPVLKQSSPATKRIMQAVYKGMSGGGGGGGVMTPQERQNQLNASGKGGGLANVAMALMGRVPAFADGGY